MNKSQQLTTVILAQEPTAQLAKNIKNLRSFSSVLIIRTANTKSWTKLNSPTAGKILDYPKLGRIDDFSQVRNWAIDQVKTEWVLFLDSDEVIAPSEATKLPSLINQTQTDGYFLARRDIFLGKELRYGETAHTSLLRLARVKKLKFARPVHEVAIINGTETQANLMITHFAHSSISQFLAKNARYAQLEAASRQQPLGRTCFELLIYPGAKFCLNYILLLGFLDGWRGLTYALLMSLHSLWVRVYLVEKHFKSHDQLN